MTDKIDLNAFISSPYSSDLKKQQWENLAESAKNIRKINESVEEYKARMAQYREELQEKTRSENTDVLQERLANLDISNIGTKNRIAIENLIREAQAIRLFAYNNNYDTNSIDFATLNKAVEAANARLRSLKNGNDNTNLGTGIFADTYKKQNKSNDDLLSKMLNNSKKK